jgi:hypothetical protein
MYDQKNYASEPDFDKNPNPNMLKLGKKMIIYDGCTHAMINHDDCKKVKNAYMWFEKNQLATKYPLCTKEYLDAIQAFSNGLSFAQSEQMEAAMNKNKK